MELYKLIEPSGIATYLSLALTAASGFLGWKFQIHRFLAITTAVIATIHGILILISQ